MAEEKKNEPLQLDLFGPPTPVTPRGRSAGGGGPESLTDSVPTKVAQADASPRPEPTRIPEPRSASARLKASLAQVAEALYTLVNPDGVEERDFQTEEWLLKKAESGAPIQGRLKAVLTSYPVEWLDAIAENLGVQATRRPLRQKRVAAKLLDRVTLSDILEDLEEDQHSLLRELLQSDEPIWDEQLARVYGSDTDSYFWSEEPPISNLGELRSLGLVYVRQTRFLRLVAIPVELREPLMALLPDTEPERWSDSEVLDRARELRGGLVSFVESNLEEEVEAFEVGRDYQHHSEREANLLEFIDDEDLGTGYSVLGTYTSFDDDLSVSDRRLVLGWRAWVWGMFVLESTSIEFSTLRDVLSQRIYKAGSPLDMTGLRVGETYLGRLVPLPNDLWLVATLAGPLGFDTERERYEFAAWMVVNRPAAAVTCPDRLAQSIQMQHYQHDVFMALFGKGSQVGTTSQIGEKLKRFGRELGQRATDGDEMAERSAGISFEHLIQDKMHDFRSLGLIFDRDNGIVLFEEYADLVDLFAAPGRKLLPHHEEILEGYLESSTIPPSAIRNLAEENPRNANQIFRTFFEMPDFDWHRDGEDMLRDYKPAAFLWPAIPSVVAITAKESEAAGAYAAAQAETARADAERAEAKGPSRRRGGKAGGTKPGGKKADRKKAARKKAARKTRKKSGRKKR